MDELAKKWKNLRTVYLRQRRRKATSKSGSAATDDLDLDWDQVDEENVGLIEKMCFLEPYVTVSHSKSNLSKVTLTLMLILLCY